MLKTIRKSAKMARKDDRQGSDFDAAFKANLRRGLGAQKPSPKTSAGASSAKRAPELGNSHHKRATAYDGPSISERVEARETTNHHAGRHENFLNKDSVKSDGVPEPFGWYVESPSLDMKLEYVKRLRQIRSNKENELRMPSMEEALKPLTDATLSKEEFFSMTEALLKNTSDFTQHILTPRFERDGPDFMERIEEIREIREVARHNQREWQAIARKRREELIAPNASMRYCTTTHEPSFISLLCNDDVAYHAFSSSDHSWIMDLYCPPPTELDPARVKLFRRQGGPDYLPLNYSRSLAPVGVQASFNSRLTRKLSGIRIYVRGRRETAFQFFPEEVEGLDGSLIGRMQDRLESVQEFQAHVSPQTIGRESVSAWREGPGRSKDWKSWPRRAFSTGNAMGLAQQQISAPRLLTFNQNPLLYRQMMLKTKAYRALESSKNMPESRKSRLYEFRQDVSLADEESDGGFGKMQVFPALSSGEMLTSKSPVNHITTRDLPWLSETDRSQDFHRGAIDNDLVKLHYVGEILKYECKYYRVLQHLRTETHGVVYSFEELDSGLEYEVKVYVLRGIPPNERNRKVKDLKSATMSPLFMFSFDANAKKYCVFLPTENVGNSSDGSLQSSAKVGRKTPQISTLNRRNTPQYDAAFPPLPSMEPERSNIQRRARKTPKWRKYRAQSSQEAHLLNDITGVASQDELCVIRTCYILEEELLNRSPRWASLPAPMPLASRIMIRLEELCPSWRQEAAKLLGDQQTYI